MAEATPGRPRAGRLPPDERRAAIVAATLPLLLRHGAAVSTRQIAEAGGIAEGTIFRAFGDKDTLMSAVLRQAFDPTSTLHELARIDRALPLRQRLVAAATVLRERLTGIFGLIDAMGVAGPPPHPENDRSGRCPRPSHDELTARLQAGLVELIEPDAGLLRVSADEFAHVMRLLVFAGSHPRISGDRTLTPETIVGLLLDGLLVRPEPPPPSVSPARTHPTTNEDERC